MREARSEASRQINRRERTTDARKIVESGKFWRTDLYSSLPARQTACFGSTFDLLDGKDEVSAMTIVKFP